MNHTVKLLAEIQGDQMIDTPTLEVEVADEGTAIQETINYGSRRFSLYEIDVVTLPNGKVIQSDQKRHLYAGIMVTEAPRKRDDAITWYTQKLTDAFAQAAGGSYETKTLQDGIDYLKAAESDDYFICEGICVGRPERRGFKYFDYNKTLVLDLNS